MTRYYWYTQLVTLASTPPSRLHIACAELFNKHIGSITASQILYELAQAPRWSEEERQNENQLLDVLVQEAIHHGLQTTDSICSGCRSASLMEQIAELVIIDATMSPSAAALYERLISIEHVEDQFILPAESLV